MKNILLFGILAWGACGFALLLKGDTGLALLCFGFEWVCVCASVICDTIEKKKLK